MSNNDQNKGRVRKYAPDAVLNAERFGISSAPDCNGMKIMVIAGKRRNAGGTYEWTAQPVYAVRRSLWRILALRLKTISDKVFVECFRTRGEW